MSCFFDAAKSTAENKAKQSFSHNIPEKHVFEKKHMFLGKIVLVNNLDHAHTPCKGKKL